MGVTIRQRPKGSGVYWLFIHHDGRRKSKRIGKDLETAKEVKRKINKQLKINPQEIFAEPSRNSKKFNAYADEWLEVMRISRKLSTVEIYIDILDRLVRPGIGSMRVSDIDIRTIDKMMLGYKKYSASTLRHISTTIYQPLERARTIDRAITENPAERCIPRNGLDKKGDPNKVKPKEKIKCLSYEQIGDLRKAGEKLPENWPFFLFLLETGCRIGEVLAPEWDDLHLDEELPYVEITKTNTRGRITPPKTGKSRDVVLTPELVLMFRNLKAQTDIRPSVVFHRDGKHSKLDQRRWQFGRLMKAAGISGFSPHALRHTYISDRINRMGVPIHIVAEQVGHENIKTTQGYLHTSNEDKFRYLSDPHTIWTQPMRNQLAMNG